MKDKELINELFSFLGVIWRVDGDQLIYRCTRHKPTDDEKVLIEQSFKKLKFKKKDIVYKERW
ncbi:MAG: hypothetical protein KBT03_04810 [Bacteroidales bacterium]|nr:hypothetical protein [Candidatus Scybalousia scybalohippi]